MAVGVDGLVVGQQASGPLGGEKSVAVRPGCPADRHRLGEVIGESAGVLVEMVAVHRLERLADPKVHAHPS